MKGHYVAVILVLLTGIVGSLFIYLGPKATEKNPGVVHIGIRYLDEMTIAFTHYPQGGPGATIELVAPDESIAYTLENLKIGRNLMPLQDVPAGPYTARLSAADYETVQVPIIVEGRMINPPRDAEFSEGTYAAYNMIGVWFKPEAD
jgi:hypothetical protein